MSLLWTAREMVTAMGGRPFGNLPMGVTGISIDSRTITPGEAFFAIKGDRVDGHDYASIAIANGAALLVVSEAKLPALGRLTIPMIVVEDVLVGLQKLGMAARDRTPATVIAVTGSVGKTTTKEMLRMALAPSGKVHASVASFNNHWGVPLTLARMPIDTRYGVFELGMNHPGEIGPLSRMVRPDVAIITTIAPAHLGNFSSVDEIADAKAEIFEGVVNGGDAILNRDNPYYERLEQAALAQGVENIHSFGQHAKAEFRLAEFDGAAELSTVWVSFGGETREVTIGAPGRHLAENAMAVLAAVSLVGADVDAAIEAFASLSAVKGRGQRHRLKMPEGALTLIDESYNANPASMRAAIAVLASAQPGEDGRRIAVLGDMLEMGEFAPSVHAELAGPLLASGIEHVWLAGPEMVALRDALPETVHVVYFETTDELVNLVTAEVRAGDVVMIKSSLGIGFGKIVAALLDKYPAFPDTERHF
ncbi:UDP-N-acetylmuramoylalanyl-D-glutamyl-2,6-diaminopimelate--D-alanyl-D-alanine ligase [Rhizobium rosettiformans]|uniref:UDP-N-acetylmuramoylalanyl-D-glutamyl-2, 6-diaminopimelate--D-alanyl-D-alanine ligase n=1 Tax=Rhizobium rosettiformans TaxID=1368430 RepID=UPI002865284A|nr:UDP-N-acetylmuramoylalanyl-D-glutamyl-2,6-diaminopimelate--D-alanyl-D-alanine ligase [Rhizobium rosettiformans]MDR7029894.1 UDP-N-acetylmuramoyl-tripeptide--D-alanyl-D-alanine ligase [Rhizobium rosettiformans]MDR7063608.1 UDP-N-acetylmuramoyl-tripeptide--D-alanyl-D-alanine ligase [Rhizobium rosettiformans]